MYLPNGNPAPGPKFDYKLNLFERLTGYSQSLLDSGAPAPISRGDRKFESISLQSRIEKSQKASAMANHAFHAHNAALRSPARRGQPG
jgi:exonuclease III